MYYLCGQKEDKFIGLFSPPSIGKPLIFILHHLGGSPLAPEEIQPQKFMTQAWPVCLPHFSGRVCEAISG